MKKTFISLLTIFAIGIVAAQNNRKTIYNPELNAVKQINEAVEEAYKSSKHVLVQVGGDWCPWCIKLHQFIEEHPAVDSLIKADYVYILVNYDKKNKSPEAMKILDYPQRFGFPVLVVLDGKRNRIHTQNTLYLEEGKSYNEKMLIDFLKAWNTKAIDPENYY